MRAGELCSRCTAPRGNMKSAFRAWDSLDAAVAASVNILVTVNVTNIEAVTIQEPARRIGRGFHAEPGPK